MEVLLNGRQRVMPLTFKVKVGSKLIEDIPQ